ncbi:hypothetical protein CALCODRAFT_501436 [Calocera cornea HHB12733]|uniref:Uncharacterized protein n=1 Tax=Calocera cornea HHB12733 TaxID=1353952 RepID=A0A165DM01_9BASI|nr:hypothetical protein CALCODRAFT_501436 [Calocera cornea HHB12733]
MGGYFRKLGLDIHMVCGWLARPPTRVRSLDSFSRARAARLQYAKGYFCWLRHHPSCLLARCCCVLYRILGERAASYFAVTRMTVTVDVSSQLCSVHLCLRPLQSVPRSHLRLPCCCCRRLQHAPPSACAVSLTGHWTGGSVNTEYCSRSLPPAEGRAAPYAR